MRIKPAVRPISMSDFPRTPWAVSFGVRAALLKAFNYCRQYPDKMESFKATLQFVQRRVAEWEAAAKEVEFEGGSQKAPMVSNQLNDIAQVTTSTGAAVLPEHKPYEPAEGINDNYRLPQSSALTPDLPTQANQHQAYVQQHVAQEAPVQVNEGMTAQQAIAQVTPVVGGAYGTLEQRLAQLRAQQN